MSASAVKSKFAWAGSHAKELERTAEAQQILRMMLSDVPAGHIIDVSKMRPAWLGKKIAGLVAIGADVSHDTVLLAHPKGQDRYFIVIRKGSVKTAPGTYALDYPIGITNERDRAVARGRTKAAVTTRRVNMTGTRVSNRALGDKIQRSDWQRFTAETRKNLQRWGYESSEIPIEYAKALRHRSYPIVAHGEPTLPPALWNLRETFNSMFGSTYGPGHHMAVRIANIIDGGRRLHERSL